jgi:hypothetical protein
LDCFGDPETIGKVRILDQAWIPETSFSILISFFVIYGTR